MNAWSPISLSPPAPVPNACHRLHDVGATSQKDCAWTLAWNDIHHISAPQQTLEKEPYAAGIAALPYTNSLLGWPLATLALVLMAYATFITLRILVR